jgi:ferrous iron transport protein B
MIFALAGNQNAGKTTLFNALTGSNQHVGNFPGVTVDQKIGEIRSIKDASVVDLPGIYSMRTFSNEEIVTRDFILNQHPDGIIDIVDATNIERNLYLTLQLITLNIPMVIALNMMDEVTGNGGSIDVEEFSKRIGVPVVPISASKNEGVTELISVAEKTVRAGVHPLVTDFCEPGPMHRCIHSVSLMIEDHAQSAGLEPRYCATKLIEGEKGIAERIGLVVNEREMIEHDIKELESESGLDRNEAIADMRYTFIEKVCDGTVKRAGESKEYRRSMKIDSVLTNKYLSFPIFLGVMLLVFWLTFDVIGAWLQELLARGIDDLSAVTQQSMIDFGTNPVVRSLVINGIFAGVGSIISFLPIIIVLFFFLSILEDTGYMARVAFIMDKALRKIGLSGKSVVPMLIGFGCTVPAVMSARTLSSERDRHMTVLLTPFMSCSAKIPIYAMFTAAFFPHFKALVMLGLYVLGILLGVIAALVLKSTAYKGNPVPFVMELPNYRFPSAKTVGILLWQKAKDFLERAFTVIFVATLVIWFLETFDTRINVVSDSSYSMLASIGRFIAPLFAPLGFADWRTATALITGFTAKEAVISTMSVLTGTSVDALPAVLSTLFTPVTAISFLVFVLLYTPCVAAISTIKKELGSALKTAGVVVSQCAIAWAAAFVVYHIALAIAG